MHKNKNIFGLKLPPNINEQYTEIKASSPASTPRYSPVLPSIPVLTEIVSYLSNTTGPSKREFEYSFKEGNAVETHKLVAVVSPINKTTIKYETRVEFSPLNEVSGKKRSELFSYQNEDLIRPISPKSPELTCIKDCLCVWM